MIMKNVILIHGINGVPKIFEWLKAELEKFGYQVIMPSFPVQEGTVYEKWKRIMDEYRRFINENSIIVCHSIGNEFIIKYLAQNEIKIDTYIGLAGFAEIFYNEDKDVLNAAVERFAVNQDEKRDFVALTGKRYAIYSDNDHIVPLEVLERYPKEVDAEPIFIPGIGHMGKRSGLEEMPELLGLVKENLYMMPW